MQALLHESDIIQINESHMGYGNPHAVLFFYVSNLIIIMFLLLTKYVLLPQNFFVGVNHGQEVGSLH